MFIFANDINFKPKNFVIYNFYGIDTCFCWCDNKLVTFQYASNDREHPVQVLIAPATILKISYVSGRIFVICYPSGVYKLSRNQEFAVLSKSGIGIGTVFYEVLTPKDGYLYLENKQNKLSKSLLQISSLLINASKLCTFSLNAENTDKHFRIALSGMQEHKENLCIIANEKQIFMLVNETVQIIYNCEYCIIDIIPIYNCNKIVGLVFLTNTDLITVIYSKNNKLLFENIHLGTKIQALCTGICQWLPNVLWVVHCDDCKLYYSIKTLGSGTVKRITTENNSFVCLRFYKAGVILGLSKYKQLTELSLDIIEKSMTCEGDNFVNIHSEMLKGSELVVDQICEKIKELELLNELLLTKQDKLRRINFYAYKQKIQFHPNMLVRQILNQQYIMVDFQDILPKNTEVVVFLESECQKIISMKEVVSKEIQIEIPIFLGILPNSFHIAIDSVTLISEGNAWCLIKNVMNDAIVKRNKKIQLKKDKVNLIHTKITLLKDLMAEGNLDIQKLSEIKRIVREEMPNV